MAPVRLNRRMLAVPEAIRPLRRDVVAFAEELGAGELVRGAVRLAVSEALTNAVMHAYAGRQVGEVSVAAWPSDGEQLVVVVRDEGRGLVSGRRSRSRGLGLGMGLMARLADEFQAADRTDAPGAIVTLRFSLMSP